MEVLNYKDLKKEYYKKAKEIERREKAEINSIKSVCSDDCSKDKIIVTYFDGTKLLEKQ